LPTAPQKSHRLRDPLEVLRPEVSQLEKITDEPARDFSYDAVVGSAIPGSRAASFGVSPTTMAAGIRIKFDLHQRRSG
jgi:hypothetical protein